MTIGAGQLISKYGTRLRLAEALLRGELDSLEQKFVSEVVDMVILEAAKFRVQNGLDKQFIQTPKPTKTAP